MKNLIVFINSTSRFRGKLSAKVVEQYFVKRLGASRKIMLRWMFCAGFFLTLAVFAFPATASASSIDDMVKETSICNIVRNIDKYDGENVAFEAEAVAALHDFGIALYDEKCKDRNIFLRADQKFSEDKDFNKMMKILYPGYPNEDGYVDSSVRVKIEGRIFLKNSHNILSTYVDLKDVKVVNAP